MRRAGRGLRAGCWGGGGGAVGQRFQRQRMRKAVADTPPEHSGRGGEGAGCVQDGRGGRRTRGKREGRDAAWPRRPMTPPPEEQQQQGQPAARGTSGWDTGADGRAVGGKDRDVAWPRWRRLRFQPRAQQQQGQTAAQGTSSRDKRKSGRPVCRTLWRYKKRRNKGNNGGEEWGRKLSPLEK